MSTESSQGTAASECHELAALQSQWWCFLLLGVLLIVLGAIALGSSFFVTVVTVALFGVLLLIAGITEIITSFWAGKWSGMFVHILIGLLYVVGGFFIIDAPLEGALFLTKVIAILLIVSGIFRIITSLVDRYPGSGWVLLNGVVSLMLGIMIYRGWPASGLWVIGLFIGIELIFNGWAWVMLSLDLRRLRAD